MILVDTSIWIDHARQPVPGLAALLNAGRANIHEFVIGELLLGTPGNRRVYARFLNGLPRVVTAGDGFVRTLIDEAPLHSTGIGYVDAHLLASTLLVDGGSI